MEMGKNNTKEKLKMADIMGKEHIITSMGTNMKDSMQTGKARTGTYYFSNGYRYEGEFANDNVHGEESYIIPMGANIKDYLKTENAMGQEHFISPMVKDLKSDMITENYTKEVLSILQTVTGMKMNFKMITFM